jgi:chromosome segregation ATPase
MIAPRHPTQADRDQLNRAISELRILADACGDVESMDAERARAKAQLDVTTKDVAQMKQEFDEVKRAHDKILGAAHDKQAELERIEAELKRKYAELGSVSQQMAKMRQQLGG